MASNPNLTDSPPLDSGVDELESMLLKAFDRGYEVARQTTGLADDKFIAHQETMIATAKESIMQWHMKALQAAEEQALAKQRMLLEELREDAEDDTWTVGRLDEIIGYSLPVGHPDYWKWHCVTCGKWRGHEMEDRGDDYCECE